MAKTSTAGVIAENFFGFKKMERLEFAVVYECGNTFNILQSYPGDQ